MTAELKGIHAKTFQDLDVIKDVLKLDERKIAELEKENALLKGRNEGFEQQIMGLLIKYEEVYKRFPDLKSAMDKAQTILKENAELKKKNLDTQDAVTMQMYTNKANKEIADRQLTKAKELLKEFVQHYKAKTIYIENMQDLLEQAEQFLNSEVEK